MPNIKNNTTHVGECFLCKKSAAWNSPALDPDGNLWCDACKDDNRRNILFHTVEQRMVNGKYVLDGGVALNGVIVWKDKSCWVEGGSRSVRLTEEEQKMSPIEIAIILNQEYNLNKLTRCTGCGKALQKDEIAGYPLFAGVCCAPCYKKHLDHLETQRKSGHVCGFCGKPYDACYC